MAKKMTKSEQKRLSLAILSKAQKLWGQNLGGQLTMTTKDFIAIEQIIKRTIKRIQ